MSDQELQRLHELADAVVEQTIGDEQARELVELLRTSDAARRHYVRYLGLSASLHHYAGRLPAPALVETPPAPTPRLARHWRTWMLSACLLLAIGAWLTWRWASAPVVAWPVVEAVFGELEVESNGTTRAITEPTQLAASDRVRVPANALAMLRYPDATVVELRPDTAVQLDADVSRKVLLLEQGAVFAEVQPGRTAMTIVTPNARAIALATRFLLTATADDTRLDVQRGTTQFASRQQQPAVAVAGGQVAVATAHAAVQVTNASPASENLVLNPGFELEAPNGKPPHWGGNRLAQVSRDAAHTGVSSLKVVGPSTFSYVWQSVALEPDTSYRLRVWIKTDGVTGTDGVRARYAQIGPRTVIWHRAPVRGTSDWVQWQTEFRTPADYCFGRLDLTWELNAGETAWFDDVELVKTHPAP